MKLYSWNVNGIRAVLNKGAFQQFVAQHQPDVLCLQEIKAKEELGLQPGKSNGEEMLGNRKANWYLEVLSIDIDDLAQELNEGRYIVSWQEGGTSKEASLSTYVKSKK